MKINLPNNRLHFNTIAQHSNESIKSMNDKQQYDEYMHKLIADIQKKETSDEVEEFLADTSEKGENLEKLSSVLYKHRDTHITILFDFFGTPFVENLKILNKLNLQCVPEYVETINKNGTMFVVTKQKGTEDGNLEAFFSNKDKISKEEKLKTFHQLQNLTKAGFVDDGILKGVDWYVTPENTIMLPVWQRLRKIQPNESQQEIIQKYYDIIFK